MYSRVRTLWVSIVSGNVEIFRTKPVLRPLLSKNERISVEWTPLISESGATTLLIDLPYLGTHPNLEVSVQKSQMITWTGHGHGNAAALLSQRPPVFCVDNAREQRSTSFILSGSIEQTGSNFLEVNTYSSDPQASAAAWFNESVRVPRGSVCLLFFVFVDQFHLATITLLWWDAESARFGVSDIHKELQIFVRRLGQSRAQPDGSEASSPD